MESITAFVISIATTLVLLMIVALISNAINFERGSRPKDPARRRLWFWVIAVLNPAIIFLLGYYMFRPDANIMIVNRYFHALSVGAVMGFVLYITIGFVLSKIFKNGKISHWF